MPRNQQQSAGFDLTPAQGFNLIFIFLAGYAACFQPFTRSNFGVRHFHVSGIAAMVIMVFYAGFGHCPEMLPFLAVWFALIVWHRVVSLSNEREAQYPLDV